MSFISWLQSPSAVILEPPQKSLSLFPLFPHLFAIKSLVVVGELLIAVASLIVKHGL